MNAAARVIKRLLSSTFVLTALMLVLFDVGVKELRPLRLLNHTGMTTINQNFLVSKLPLALADSKKADVLLMGSSLVLFPSVRCDDEYHGVKTRYDRWYLRNHLFEYSRADYFEHLLSERAGKPIGVLNTAVAAGMMSDQYLILKKYLDSGKRPGLVVVALAPRDFLDTQRSEVEKTPTYSILADFACVGDLLAKKASPQELGDFLFGTASSFYKSRADYSTFLQTLASRLTGHPTSMYTATEQMANKDTGGEEDGGKGASECHMSIFDGEESVLGFSKPDYGPRQNTLGELDHYQQMYLPVNYKLFDTQAEYLDKFLALAKKHDIPAVIVDMPLTRENLAILPAEALEKYENLLAERATAAGAKLIRPATVDAYELDDFEDCAHMSARGGKKLFGLLAKRLTQDQSLAGSMDAGKSRISLFSGLLTF